MKWLTGLLCLFFLMGPVMAETSCSLDQSIGELVRLEGTVSLQRAQGAATPKVGMAVCKGDVFSTDTNALVFMRLKDGTLLTVAKASTFAIDNYRFNDQQPNLATFELLKGAFRAVSGAITQNKHRFEVKTTVATIGVRGTDFWGGFGLSPDAALDVLMLEGKGIYVRNRHGKVELTQAGSGTTVQADGTLGAVKHWPEMKVKRALATISLPPKSP